VIVAVVKFSKGEYAEEGNEYSLRFEGSTVKKFSEFGFRGAKASSEGEGGDSTKGRGS